MSRYRIKVDMLLCQGHGVCTEECPEIFSVEEKATGYPKVKVKNSTPPDELLAAVQDAVDYCPNRTIRLVEID
jgi:ferredoxin